MRDSFCSRLLARLLPPAVRDELTGDLDELYVDDRAVRGRVAARVKWCREAVLLVLCTRAPRVRRAAGVTPDGVAPRRFATRAASFGGSVIQDVRLALRGFTRAPGFALVVIATLALGIGANTAVFSVVDGVLLRPLPFPDPDALVHLEDAPISFGPPIRPSRHLAASRAFDAIGLYAAGGLNAGGGAEPERVNAAGVNAEFFDVLGVPPLAGRTIRPPDVRQGTERVAVIGERLWRRRFAASSDAIGGTMILNGSTFRVLGVMPAEMDFPSNSEIWIPVGSDRQLTGAVLFPRVLARLAPGVTPAQAARELDRIRAVTGERAGQTSEGPSIVIPLRNWLVGSSGPIVLLVAAGVGLVLLIACLNTANLLLARVASRDRELMVRRALGAGRGRLVRQLFTEHLTLAASAGAVALLAARWMLAGLRLLLPPSLHGAGAIALDGRVLVVASALVVATAIVSGTAPAVSALADRRLASFRSAVHSASGRGWQRFRQALVIAEVAMALVLVAGAGVVFATVARVLAVDLGPRTDSALTMRMLLPLAVYGDIARTRQTLERLQERVEAIPGVTVMGMGSLLPGSRETGIGVRFHPEGFPGQKDARATFVHASAGYFRALKIPMVRGRDFTPADRRGSPPVVIVSESAARRYWPADVDPIGRRLTLNLPKVQPMTVVGIARDVLFRGPESRRGPQVYVPFGQMVPFGTIYAAVATIGSPASYAGAIRTAVREVDPNLPIYDVQPYRALVAGYVAERRFAVLMLGAFGAIALVLAAVGLYGVMAYLVALRTSEIGIRVALGARPAEICRRVLGEGLGLAAAGILLGCLAAVLLMKTLRSMVSGVEGADPAVLAATAALMLAVAALAAWIPARRATRVDPLVSLRAE